jgi:hypothetical protein
MAFSRSGLCRIGGSGTGGSAWQYSSADAKATVVATDYMLLANDELNIGDVVTVIDTSTPATPEVFITYVKAQSATSVDLAGGLVVTA